MHLHIAVDNLAQSISFYQALFGAAPTTLKEDYAKWMLDDPRVNFAISQRGVTAGLDHIGIQVESDEELTDIQTRLANADLAILSQEATTCCYAVSDKHWVQDPSGITWETYRTLDSAPTFHSGTTTESNSACCAPVSDSVATPVAFVRRK